jgi:hypothetical protein
VSAGAILRRHEPCRYPSATAGDRNRKEKWVICESIWCSSEISMGVKGVYHINTVDEVIQWQIAGATDSEDVSSGLPE